jgi:2-hydroxychromene-2-carboxylate isomerase
MGKLILLEQRRTEILRRRQDAGRAGAVAHPRRPRAAHERRVPRGSDLGHGPGVVRDTLGVEEFERRERPRPVFFFSLGCPLSYLAIERIERLLGEVDWIPTDEAPLRGSESWSHVDSMRVHVERLAVSLRLPLVWPDGFPAPVPSAMRAVANAAEIGACAPFALAASRLAFCGGFDLDDPEILAEAAAASGMPLDACLAAAGDAARDASLQATAQDLLGAGVRRLPAVRIGRRWFDGERGLAEATALMRARAVLGRPLAPVG